MRSKNTGLLISLLIIFVLAFVIRIYPLVWSPYPYNIDGLAEASMAEDIAERGDLIVPEDAGYAESYIVDMPSLNLLLALASQLIGISPLLLSQFIVASIGALSCVLVVLLIHKISGSLRAGIFGGLFLAMLGTYVFCTSSVWKESLGLTMMLLIAFLFLERRDVRARAMLVIALLMMTFVHHHSAVLTYLFFTLAVAGDTYFNWNRKQLSWNNYADFGTVAAIWALAALYYSHIDLPYYGFLSPEQDLYLFIAVLFAMAFLLIIVLSRLGGMERRGYIRIIIPVVAISLLVINYVTPIFPGIPKTEQSVFVFSMAYLLLIVPAWFGSDNLLRTREHWIPMIIALLFAPLTMILFAFLRGLDAMSYTIVFRSFDFLDFSFAILFATGIVLMVKHFKRLMPAVVLTSLLLLIVTTPIAFQTEELFSVHNQTYEYEVESYEIMSELSSERTLNSDQRLGTSSRHLFNFSGDTDLALRIEIGESLEEHHWLVVKNTWTTVGAQEFPLGQRILDDDELNSFLENNNVLIIAGPNENQLFGVIESGIDR